jgi:hypothetical protein
MGFVNGRAKDDETKKQAIVRILDVWKRNPELRLGQLIYLATNGEDIFDVEDAQLVTEIEMHFRRFRMRKAR